MSLHSVTSEGDEDILVDRTIKGQCQLSTSEPPGWISLRVGRNHFLLVELVTLSSKGVGMFIMFVEYDENRQ